MARLTLRGLTKAYPSGARVLDGVDLTIESGEFVVLVGPSGCGKSTLLRIVAGLSDATSGDVELDGRRVNDLPPAERDVAMVFQNYALYPHMTVRRNLGFPLAMARVPRAEARARVEEVAAWLGLMDLLERRPAQLSGGQMQRVALGRALVRRPRVFLFDEPLSNLDAKLREAMRSELRRLHRETGTTTLYVTHDQAEAMTMGQRICVLDGGRALQVGPPLEVYARPRTRFVAGFIGSPGMNLVDGDVTAGRFRGGAVELDAPGPDGPRTLGVRPHQVEVLLDGERAWRVESVEALGSEAHAWLAPRAGGEPRLVARLPDAARIAAGDEVGVRLAPAARHWFDGRTGARCPD